MGEGVFWERGNAYFYKIVRIFGFLENVGFFGFKNVSEVYSRNFLERDYVLLCFIEGLFFIF